MALVKLPEHLALSEAQWTMPDMRQAYESVSGRVTDFIYGPGHGWEATLTPAILACIDPREMRAFMMRMTMGGARAQVPFRMQSQYGDAGNLIANADLAEGSAGGWTLPGSAFVNRISAPEVAYYGIATPPAGGNGVAIVGNGGIGVPVTAGETLFVSGWGNLASGSDFQVGVSADYYDASGVRISIIYSAVSATADGSWRYNESAQTAPVGAVSMIPRLTYSPGSTGIGNLAAPRISRFPRRVAVASGATVYAVPVTGLRPNATNLPAGSVVTVTLAGGVEQMVGLRADLVGSGGGNGTMQLATPLRAIPGVGQYAWLDRPWARMMLKIGSHQLTHSSRTAETFPAVELVEAFSG